MKFWVAVGALMLALTGSAHAATVIGPESTPGFPWQRWIDRMAVPSADETVTVSIGTCTFSDTGCTFTDRPEIVLTPQPGVVLKWVFFHELGHRFALQYGQPPEWNDEDFAEVYKNCALGSWVDGRWVRFRGIKPFTYVSVLRGTCNWLTATLHPGVAG